MYVKPWLNSSIEKLIVKKKGKKVLSSRIGTGEGSNRRANEPEPETAEGPNVNLGLSSE